MSRNLDRILLGVKLRTISTILTIHVSNPRIWECVDRKMSCCFQRVEGTVMKLQQALKYEVLKISISIIQTEYVCILILSKLKIISPNFEKRILCEALGIEYTLSSGEKRYNNKCDICSKSVHICTYRW